MQLTLRAIRRTPHVASRAWRTRCLPGRRLSNVLCPSIVGVQETNTSHGRTTSAMRDMSTPPHPPPRQPSFEMLLSLRSREKQQLLIPLLGLKNIRTLYEMSRRCFPRNVDTLLKILIQREVPV